MYWQSTVDKLIKKTNLALVIGTHSWREQFVEAVTVSAGVVWLLKFRFYPKHSQTHFYFLLLFFFQKCSKTNVLMLTFCIPLGDGDEDEEGREERLPSCSDYFMHFITVFWKVLFAFVPPTEYWNGWACFFVSISVIGILTAVIGDLASHFGCTVGLRDTVTAVVFVALGTSIPGEQTFSHQVYVQSSDQPVPTFLNRSHRPCHPTYF